MAKQSELQTLDLHGFVTDQVFDAVDRFLRKAEAKGLKRVRILPGKGTGKVKEKVLDYLRQANYPFSLEKNERGQVNEGSLVVFLD